MKRIHLLLFVLYFGVLGFVGQSVVEAQPLASKVATAAQTSPVHIGFGVGAQNLNKGYPKRLAPNAKRPPLTP